MKNVEVSITENVLTLTVDLSQNFGPSKSGKTEIIASTEGNQPIDEDSPIRFGLNVYKQQSRNF